MNQNQYDDDIFRVTSVNLIFSIIFSIFQQAHDTKCSGKKLINYWLHTLVSIHHEVANISFLTSEIEKFTDPFIVLFDKSFSADTREIVIDVYTGALRRVWLIDWGCFCWDHFFGCGFGEGHHSKN